MYKIPNLLLVAGTGRNVGKTSFVCKLIERIAQTRIVIGIKISPHFHQVSSAEKVIIKTEDFEIIEELDPRGHKDSSRMLKAGASKIFYVQTRKDEALENVILELQKFWENDVAVICESGGLRHFVDPGLFVICKSDEQPEMKSHLKIFEHQVDQFVLFKEGRFDFDFSKISFQNNQWFLKK